MRDACTSAASDLKIYENGMYKLQLTRYQTFADDTVDHRIFLATASPGVILGKWTYSPSPHGPS